MLSIIALILNLISGIGFTFLGGSTLYDPEKMLSLVPKDYQECISGYVTPGSGVSTGAGIIQSVGAISSFCEKSDNKQIVKKQQAVIEDLENKTNQLQDTVYRQNLYIQGLENVVDQIRLADDMQNGGYDF